MVTDPHRSKPYLHVTDDFTLEPCCISDMKQPYCQDDDYFQDDHGIALGSRVSISAESFGSESTVGELVAATRTRYTLRRVDPRAGVVQVHFPRIGYVLKAVAPA